MKITAGLIACFLLAGVINAKNNDEWSDLLKIAKNTNKCIAVKVFDSNESGMSFDSLIFSGFLEMSLYSSKSEDISIITKYNVKTYPSIIMLNSAGQLLLPVKQIYSADEIKDYARRALELQYEHKPLAQMDLDYQNNKMNCAEMYEYIDKRTSLRLNNSNIIDTYTDLASKHDLLNEKTLSLFIEKNDINIPGEFCSFVQHNHEQIKVILKMSDVKFRFFLNKSVENSLNNIYLKNDEQSLKKTIEIKSTLLAEDYDIVYNELMTKYFYKTYQPLKLLAQARIFVDVIMEHNKNQVKGNSHSIASSQIFHAAHLRNMAQYIMETISNKTILNEALKWSSIADEILENKTSEIQSYILYKLGKKEEAIACMEKIYYSIPESETEKRTTLGTNLIKMKRGERLY